MMSKIELSIRNTRKFKPTLFDSGIGARLPAAYRKFFDEWRNTPPEPVHYVPYTGPLWHRDEETGEVKRKEDCPLPLYYPQEFNDVLTGGETVVRGLVKKTRYSCRNPKFWVPHVYRSVVYSEIHNKYLSTLMTKRAVHLIHKYKGLDHYLLSTKACDLVTVVALKLKRSMLMALSKKELPYSEEKNKEIYEKYEKFLIPPEEIEWYGLTFREACRKLEEIEEKQELESIVPFKHVFRTQLIEELKEEKLNEPKVIPEEVKPRNWMQKIPGFRKADPKS